MTEPQITPAGEEQPMSEAERPPGSGEVAALAQEIARIGGRLAEVDETLSRCAGDCERLGGQAGEMARLLADLSRDQEGQLNENERLDRRLGALGQDVTTQRKLLPNWKTISMTPRRNSSTRTSGLTGAWAPSARTSRRSGTLSLNSKPASMTSRRWYVSWLSGKRPRPGASGPSGGQTCQQGRSAQRPCACSGPGSMKCSGAITPSLPGTVSRRAGTAMMTCSTS